MDWDVFISHAWEDKEAFARPLAKAQEEEGLRVWYDEFTLRVGDSLRRSIDHGLANSRYGVVILSPNFFAKEWPQKELDALAAREVSGEKVILPVWHNITTDEVRKYSPILADRVAVLSDRGLEHVVEELLRVIEPASEPVHPAVTGVPLSPGEDTENNLQVRLIRKPNTQHTVFAVFEARYWAEDIGFELKTNSPIRSQGWGFPAFSGMRQISILEKKEDYLYAVQITNERIVPRSPFVMWVTFDEGVDPRKAITEVNRWDGTGGEPSLRFIDFTSQR